MFKRVEKNIYLWIALVLLTSSCSEYQRVLKSSDMDYKYEMASKYFEKEEYARSEPLFEELTSVWRGSAKSSEVYFNYAYSLYGQANFIIAAYHFKNFVKTFPNHEKKEYASFLTAYCFYNDSPVYSLDQSSTYKAIDELQLFANQFPQSEYMETVNELIEKLRGKLERKAFENARLYLNIEAYRAAIIEFNTVLFDFPDTKYKEQALFLQLNAYYKLALNSVDDKKVQRLKEASHAADSFIKEYGKGEYGKQAELLVKNINKLKEQISN